MSPPPARNAVGITSGLSSEDRFDQSRKCEGIERPFGVRRRRPVRLRSSPCRYEAWSSSLLPHHGCEEDASKRQGAAGQRSPMTRHFGAGCGEGATAIARCCLFLAEGAAEIM